MQRNWRTEYFKNLIKDKTRTKRWRKVLLCLSCVVVFWTVYALILPAITLESKKCNIEEHTHSAECYSESQELICGKEEHVHTAECTSINNDLSDSGEDAGTVPDASGNDANGNEEGKNTSEEPVIPEESVVPAEPEPSGGTGTTETPGETGEYVLNDQEGKIESVKLTYKKNEKEEEITNQGAITTPDDTYLKITVAFKDIPQKELRDNYNCSFTYKLPNFFQISKEETKVILDSANKIIGSINITDGKAVITYDEKFLANAKDGDILKGTFYVEGEIKLSQLNKENGTTEFTVPNGTITLNYGADYIQKYGKIKVEKSCKKDNRSEYIQYTIKVTASEDGAKNVVVVDTFTKNKDVIKNYENIPKEETLLNGTTNDQGPYEKIENNNSATAGKIYLGTAPTEGNKIPASNSASGNELGSLVWKIDNLAAGESRTLTYYAKLQDEGGKISTKNNQEIKNEAQLYTTGNENTIYDKGSDESTFTPRIEYAMSKSVLQNNRDADGNYNIQYKLEFNLNENSNYPLKNFVFWDYLNFGNDSSIYPYLSYDKSSIKVYERKKGGTDYSMVDSSLYTVYWAGAEGDYNETWTDNTDFVRFQIKGNANTPININPGDSYYVTYNLKVGSEVYAVMQQNSVEVKNKYKTSCQNACDSNGYIGERNATVTLNDYKWVQKTKEDSPTVEETVISMSPGETIYEYKNNELSPRELENIETFRIQPGSYKYTVDVNKTLGLWDVTNTVMKDTLSPAEMEYVGYVKITAYDEKVGENVGTKWVGIEGKSAFSLKMSRIGWENNSYSYKLEYYAKPKNLDAISTVTVRNTFRLEDNVKKGKKTFQFNKVEANTEVTLHGFYNLNVSKKAWYYEKPVENAETWSNGKLYWIIEVKGSAIKQGAQIKDVISWDPNLTDSFIHPNGESIAGIYIGALGKIEENKNLEEFESNNVGSKQKLEDLFEVTYRNNKPGFGEGKYNDMFLKAKKDITLGDQTLYVIVRTEPMNLPNTYRKPNTYRNDVYKIDAGKSENDQVKMGSAEQNLYYGGDILKELGQTFEYDGTTVTNIEGGQDQGNTGRICKELLTSGVYASWAFKVNYTGELKGDYRVLEDIPDGMELAYIRIKWPGDHALDIASKEIAGLGSEWEKKTNFTTTDREKANQETIYYVNQNGKQALIQLGSFKDEKLRDVCSVDVQVVCRVTDKDVLLGGAMKTYTNKVTLLSSDGQEKIATAQADATIQRNSLDKSHNANGQIINYTITANPLGQKLPTNTTDDNKLILVDQLNEKLELDATSISAKDSSGQLVEIEKRYEQATNTLEITIPNEKKVIITYQAIVKAAPSEQVTLTNKVYWKSFSESGGKNHEILNYSYTINAGGTTTSTTTPILKIYKYDEDTMAPMAGVKFEVAECKLNGTEIQRVTPEHKYQGVTDEKGILSLQTSEYITHYNTIYEIKEISEPEGYIKDDRSHYILFVNKDATGYDESYVNNCIANKNITIATTADTFKVQVYNSQKGIVVKKAFKNNATGTDSKPVSGIYTFGLYDNADGEGKPLEIVSIEYSPGDTGEKTAKFKNQNLNTTYYVFELDDNKHPIKASQEATINKLQYTVEYSTEGNSNGENTIGNAAKCGGTVIVTNQSQTKILPSTGSYGTLLYRLAGIILMLYASLRMLLRYTKK